MIEAQLIHMMIMEAILHNTTQHESDCFDRDSVKGMTISLMKKQNYKITKELVEYIDKNIPDGWKLIFYYDKE